MVSCNEPVRHAGAGFRRNRVSNEIISILVQQIASGELARDSRLPNERQLAEQFGVSQPTIREAVRALDAMGLVQVRHGSGAYVTGDAQYLVELALRILLQLENVNILDVLSVRSLLGDFSARRAAAEATEAEIAQLEDIAAGLDEVNSAGSIEEIAEAVVAFQVTLSAATHNPLLYALETFLISLLMQLQLAGKRQSLPEWREWTRSFSSRRHRIVDALKSHDGAAVVEAMRTYLQDLHDTFAADSDLAQARLSDPASLQVLGRVPLRPHLRPVHG
jgi:GntR family transcriptional repressor for pyruvate dehydrogenase complex